MVYLILLISIAVLVGYVFAAIEFGKVAEEKGWEDKKNIIIALCILFPIAGYLLACALPDKRHKGAAGVDTLESVKLPEL